MKPINDLTFEYVNEAIRYDPESGFLYWKERPLHHFRSEWAWEIFNKTYPGTKIGNLSASGYYKFNLKGRTYVCHRIAWLLYYKKWPDDLLDHKNLDKTDNRISNLREATYSQNAINSGPSKLNKLGIKGVSYSKAKKKYRAQIQYEKKYVHIGYYDTAEEAGAAYDKKAEELYGEFAY